MNPTSEPIIFSKFHSAFVVSMLDIVHSTEITMPLAGESVDDFYTIFLEETAIILRSHGATVIKNIGDGMLFYFPKTASVETEAFAEVTVCAKALLAGREKINAKLAAEQLPQIDFRVSFSFGAVSAMISQDGTIIDLFGSVINTCTKMNKMASPNTCIAGEVLHEKLVALGIVNAEQGSTDEKVVSEKIGDYHIGDKLSFGVWQIAK